MKRWLDIVAALCGLLMVMGCQLLNPGPISAACEGGQCATFIWVLMLAMNGP